MNKKKGGWGGNGDRAIQLATLMQPINVPRSVCALDLEWEAVPDGLFWPLEALPSPLSVRSPADREAARDCMQANHSTKFWAAPSPRQRGDAYARSLRFSLEDFFTAPFLLSSLSTFSLWSSTFIMVSLASVTWSITSLQRCMLPWGKKPRTKHLQAVESKLIGKDKELLLAQSGLRTSFL